jgi:hypothetical protein
MAALLPWENADRMRIGRLRVRGGVESTSLRLGVSAMLDRADLRPVGVPPAAVLIVRHMGDPLPGHFMPRPAATVDAAWERAARDRLAGFCRRAARPGRGPVPADAEAVFFGDEGELLASLAFDLAGGRVGDRWWWRNLLGRSTRYSTSPLASLLCERAAAVPAALELLARQGRAVEVVRALTPHEALTVLTVVGRIHGVADLTESAAALQSAATMGHPLPLLSPAILRGADGPSAVGADGHQPGSAVDAEINPLRRSSELAPPWSRWLPQRVVPAELEPAQACLLGVGLVLHRHPEVVRRPSFAAALCHWWRSRLAGTAPMRSGAPAPRTPLSAPRFRSAVANGPRRPPPPRSERSADETAPPQTTAPHPPASARMPTDTQQSVMPAALAAQPPVGNAEWAAPKAAAPPFTPQPTADDASAGPVAEAADIVAPPASPASENIAVPADVAVWLAPAEPIAAPRPAAEDGAPDSGLILEGGVETALGGVLFLVNMMCALDLPECFEDEWRLASSVGAWGVLEALGRALLAGDAANDDDPIWSALAALSGRGAGARLGAGLPRRRNYFLPAQWAAQVSVDGDKPAAWAARGGKLRLWSRAGYVLSETSRDASPAVVQASSEAQRWGLREALPRERFGSAPLAALSGTSNTGIDHALRRWLSLAVPFIRLRLIRALGSDPAVESLQEALFAHAGRLYVTATHVDLVMGLETVSLPVRLAGLDRSPGWLGEFGRAILFHFE